MNICTITPAYGRDYTSAKAAKDAWLANKDFIIEDPRSPWCGKPCNRESMRADENYSGVSIRYKGLRSQVIIRRGSNEW